MTMRLRIAAAAAALALAGACGGGVPDRLPPPPGQAAFDPAIGFAGPGSGTAALQADFVRSVPTDRILFDGDGFALDAQDRAALDSQASWLQRNPDVRITVEGYSDQRGTRDYSLALGDRRANAVANYLQARGIPASRMSVVSWGKERPVVSSGFGGPAQDNRAVTLVSR